MVTQDAPDPTTSTPETDRAAEARVHRLTLLAWGGVVTLLVVITAAVVWLQARSGDEDGGARPLSDDLADVVSYDVEADTSSPRSTTSSYRPSEDPTTRCG